MKIVFLSLTLLSPVLCSAATITAPITSGSASLLPGSPLLGAESFSVSGPGFSFTGSGINSAYTCGPIITCPLGALIPASGTDLTSEDRGVTGNITIGSASENYIALPGLATSAGIMFNFSLTTPASNPPSTLILSGPFSAQAFFGDPNFQSGNTFVFNGQGIATFNLVLDQFLPQYDLVSASFVFNVAEPGAGAVVAAALILFGIVLHLKRLCAALR